MSTMYTPVEIAKVLRLADIGVLIAPSQVLDKDIADRLHVTVAAVKWHLQHIYEKLHVHSRTEAALKFKNQQKPGKTTRKLPGLTMARKPSPA